MLAWLARNRPTMVARQFGRSAEIVDREKQHRARLIGRNHTMEKRTADEIREVRLRVLELLERLDLPLRKPPADATWEACNRDALANKENLDILRAAIRKKVLGVLEDDWTAIERILENRRPQTLVRLNSMREEILQHTDPAKICECWLESRNSTFGPSQALEEKIKELAEELRHVAESEDEDDMEVLLAGAPGVLGVVSWAWRHGRRHPVIVSIGVLALLGIVGVPWYLRTDHLPSQNKRAERYLSPDPNTHKTDLYPKTKAKIDKRAEYLIREKIDPWLTMGSTKTTITLHDGRTYGYYGVEYGGSVVKVFWERLIDPFLEDAIQEVLDDVGKECRTNNVDAAAPLDEAGSLLRAMVDRVFTRMVSVDQRLRTRANKKEAPRRDVQWEIERMERVVNEQLKAAKALYLSSGA